MIPSEPQILPMTRLETLLKSCLGLRPDMKDHILTAEELTGYIAWMAENFGNRPGYEIHAKDIADMKTPVLADLGTRILGDPTDTQAFRQLNEGYRTQRESRYILSDHDISVAQVLRYMPAHWHSNDYFEVYYALSGECPLWFPNDVVTLRSGSILIVAPRVIHANPCYADDACLRYYMVRASTFDEVFWKQLPSGSLMASFFQKALSGQQANSYLHFETDADEDIGRLMRIIYREYLEDQVYSAQMMNALMSLCFTLLLRRYEGTARLPRTEDFYWKHEFSAILSYIQANYATVRLSELAARYHYSQRQITRIVQSYTGMNFANLITKLRMEHAATMLKTPGVSISSIAPALGYSTVSSFYRAFSAYYGCTPAAYQADEKQT